MEINLKNVIEAALMVCNKAMDIERIQSLFVEDKYQPDRQEILKAIAELQEDYAGRGMELIEVKSGYRFQTRQEVAQWVNHLWEEKPARYSRATLETLALIAYRQPITRSEIEDVRGVSVSTNIIRTLEERNWIRVVGHKDLPGRPAMFATTKQFLDDLNLKSLEDLPSLMDVRDLDKIQQELFGDEADTATEESVAPQAEESTSEEPLQVKESEGVPVTMVENTTDESEVDEVVLQELQAEEDLEVAEMLQGDTTLTEETEPSVEELLAIEEGTEEQEVVSEGTQSEELYQTPEKIYSSDDQDLDRAIDEVFEHIDDDEVVEFKELDFAMPEFHVPPEHQEDAQSEDLMEHGFQEVDHSSKKTSDDTQENLDEVPDSPFWRE